MMNSIFRAWFLQKKSRFLIPLAVLVALFGLIYSARAQEPESFFEKDKDIRIAYAFADSDWMFLTPVERKPITRNLFAEIVGGTNVEFTTVVLGGGAAWEFDVSDSLTGLLAGGILAHMDGDIFDFSKPVSMYIAIGGKFKL